jgi:hypothetical protein
MAEKSEVFISYKWGGESEEIALKVYEILKRNAYKVIIDKKDVGYRSNIDEFERRIGRGDYIIPIIGDGYLKSEHCMHEMLCICNKGEIWKRIFPVVLKDANIYNDIKRMEYINYWQKEKDDLEEKLRNTIKNFAGTDNVVETITLYDNIRLVIDKITGLLKKMNILSAEVHHTGGFKELLDALNLQMIEDVSSIPHELSPHRLPTTGLLPYLGDRKPQKNTFSDYIDNFRTAPYRPLLAFMHGPLDECHDRFIALLRLEILPALSEFEGDECLKHEKIIDWPSSIQRTTIDDSYRHLLLELIMKIGGESPGEEGLKKAIMLHPFKTLCIRHNISLKSWNNREAELVRRAVTLWDNICCHIAGKRLFVFFCFKYDPHKQGWFGLNSIARQIESFVENFRFESYANIYGMRFPRLHSPELIELDDYIEIRGIEIAGSVQRFRMIIENLYKNKYRKKTLPMQTIGIEIEDFMDKITPQRQ